MQKENKRIVPKLRKSGCSKKGFQNYRRHTGIRRLWSTTDPVTGGKKTGKFSEVLMAHIGLQNLQSAYEKKQLHFQKTKVKA